MVFKGRITINTKYMSALIASSSALFLATTGFTYASLITWAGNDILLILGGGLGLIDALIGWIIALAIITLVIHLIFRGLRFLHILGR